MYRIPLKYLVDIVMITPSSRPLSTWKGHRTIPLLTCQGSHIAEFNNFEGFKRGQLVVCTDNGLYIADNRAFAFLLYSKQLKSLHSGRNPKGGNLKRWLALNFEARRED